MTALSASDSLQRLAEFDQQLNSIVNKKGSLNDIFIKSVTAKNVFEPRERVGLTAFLFTLKRVFSKKYNLADNLGELQKYFALATNIDAKDFGKLQKKFTPDLEEMVNDLAKNLEKIRDNAITALETKQKTEKNSKKQAVLTAKINNLKAISFVKIDVEEKCMAKFTCALNAAVASTAKELLGTESPDVRASHCKQLLENILSENVPDGIRIDTTELLKSFTQSIETARRSQIEQIEQEIIKLLETPTETQSIAQQLDAISIIKTAILTRQDVSESQKSVYQQNLDQLETELLRRQLEAKALPKGELQQVIVERAGGRHYTITYRGELSETAQKTVKAASIFTVDTLLKTLGYIAYDLCTKDTSAMITFSYALSLAAPLLAVYTSNTLAMQSSVLTAAKPFMLSLLTQILAKTAAPYVAHIVHKIV